MRSLILKIFNTVIKKEKFSHVLKKFFILSDESIRTVFIKKKRAKFDKNLNNIS